MTKRDELIAERAELIAKIRAATGWGAAVGARHERIKGIDRQLARLSAIEAPAAGDGEPAFPTWGAEDEAYELGKRDGYESAIQDLDLATGGDGEFKGSTIPGCTVDVPAMKARIVGRTTAPPADAGMREALEQLRKEADSAYCRFLDKMSSKPCLGHEAKISNGTFGVTELEAHRHAKELLGFHRGIYHAIKALTAPGATTKSDGDEPSSRTAGGFPVAAAPYHAEETGVIQPTRERAGIERGMDQGVTGGESATTNSSPSEPKNYFFETEEEAAEAADNGRNTGGKSYYRPSDPSSTRSEVTGDARTKIEWWLNEISGCNERMWNDSHASYFGQIAKGVAEIRALLDQFEIRRK